MLEFTIDHIIQIVFGIVGALGTLIAFLWKFFIVPNAEFKKEVTEKLKNIDFNIISLEKKIDNVRDDGDKVDENLEDKMMKEINGVKEDHEKLVSDVNRHIENFDRKNEKLLDIIIRYFTDNKD